MPVDYEDSISDDASLIAARQRESDVKRREAGEPARERGGRRARHLSPLPRTGACGGRRQSRRGARVRYLTEDERGLSARLERAFCYTARPPVVFVYGPVLRWGGPAGGHRGAAPTDIRRTNCPLSAAERRQRRRRPAHTRALLGFGAFRIPTKHCLCWRSKLQYDYLFPLVRALHATDSPSLYLSECYIV